MPRNITVVDAPETPFIYELRGGLIQRHPLAHRLPQSVGDCFFHGGFMARTVLAALPDLAAMVDRICPWIRCYVGGTPLRPDDDRTDFADFVPRSYIVDGVPHSPVGGLACYSHRPEQCVILLDGTMSGPHTFSVLAHECMHQVHRHLSGEVRAMLSADLHSARCWESSYLDSDEETACRAFQHWYAAQVQGLPLVQPTGIADLLFTRVAFGEWATGLMRRGGIAVSPHVLRRRGLLVRATTVAAEQGLSRLMGIAAHAHA